MTSNRIQDEDRAPLPRADDRATEHAREGDRCTAGLIPLADDRDQVRLFPFSARHLPATREWMHDPRVAQPFLFDRRPDPQAHQAWFDALRTDTDQRVLAIEAAGLGHVGNLGFRAIDRRHRRAEIWIYLGDPKGLGQGIATRALRLAIEFACERLGLRKLSLLVAPENVRAVHLYERCGFTAEGVARGEFEWGGRRLDMMRMGLTDADRPGRPLRVALMQPACLPWLGYFELMDAVDLFILLDDYQFSRQSWSHRNRIFVAKEQVGYVTIPVHHPNNLNAAFRDIRPILDARFRARLLRQVAQSYARAPFVEEILHVLTRWLDAGHDTLAALLADFIARMAAYIGIATPLRCSSQLGVPSNLPRSRRLCALLAAVGAGRYYSPAGSFAYLREDGVFPLPDLPVFFQDHQPRPYPQVQTTTFVPRLSTLDAACNLSPSSLRETMRATRQWLSWDEALESRPLPEETAP